MASKLTLDVAAAATGRQGELPTDKRLRRRLRRGCRMQMPTRMACLGALQWQRRRRRISRMQSGALRALSEAPLGSLWSEKLDQSHGTRSQASRARTHPTTPVAPSTSWRFLYSRRRATRYSTECERMGNFLFPAQASSVRLNFFAGLLCAFRPTCVIGGGGGKLRAEKLVV